MAGTTIGGAYISGISLTSKADNPAYVTGSISVSSGIALAGDPSIAWTVINSGLIYGDYGARFVGDLALTNQTTGTIEGLGRGVDIRGAGTVINYGSIESSGYFGQAVVISGGGSVTNNATGTINGGKEGVYFHGFALNLANYGAVIASSKGGIGVYGELGGTITNEIGGTISGAAKAVSLAGGYTNLVVDDPGATFNGLVDGGNTIGASKFSTLELGSAFTGGTLQGLGTQFINFAVVTIDSGAYWTLNSDTLGAGYTIQDAGTLTNTGSLGSTVTVMASGILSNASTGVIADGAGGIGVYGSGKNVTVGNAGQVGGGTDTVGVYLDVGGIVSNQSTGTISGVTGIIGHGASTTLVDAGSIAGSVYAVRLPAKFNDFLVLQPGANFSGVVNGGNAPGSGYLSFLELDPGSGIGTLSGVGSQIVNVTNVTITYGATWVLNNNNFTSAYLFQDSGTATNEGQLDVIARLAAGGSLSNASSGTIISATPVYVGSGATDVTLVNAGDIDSTGLFGVGVYGGGSGSFINQSSGTIGGVRFGIGVYIANDTVTNAGTITGGNAAVHFTAAPGNRLIVDPGAVFNGKANGGNAVAGAYVSSLELASGATAGTLSGLGSQYINFAAITVDANATWTFASNNLGAGYSVYDNGALTNTGVLDDTVTLGSNALLSNGTAGVITGYHGVRGGPATVVNAGSIYGTGAGGIGVYLQGGQVTNQAGGTIKSDAMGVQLQSAGSVLNNGYVDGVSAIGVYLYDGGVVTNQGSGVIRGGVDGIKAKNGAGTVTNQGSITGDQTGIVLSDGGSVYNESGGSIVAGSGIATNNTATVRNAGYIEGSGATSYGILLLNGSVTNQSGATIVGAHFGVETNQAGTVVNDGSIGATSLDGVYLYVGGSVTNTTGTITGGTNGVHIKNAAGTVLNGGTIMGGTDAVLLAAKYANRVVIDPKAVFSGVVDGGNAVGTGYASTLELASGAKAGTLTGLGSQYVNFSNIVVDASATWRLADTIGADYVVTDNGSMINTGSLGSPVTLGAGAYLSNAAAGTISATSVTAAVLGTAANDSVNNAGLISATSETIAAVLLVDGGSVTNSGSIGGAVRGVVIQTAAGSVYNSGTITAGTNRPAIVLGHGGQVSNSYLIQSTNGVGIYGTNGVVSVLNSGIIDAGAAGPGVFLLSGGYVSNSSTGTIHSPSHPAVYIEGGSGTLINAGSILSDSADGVHLKGGGTLTNQGAGTISAHFMGVSFAATGYVLNTSGALITGGTGIYMAAGGTVTDAGTITGTSGTAINLNGTGTNLLVLDPGASINGKVVGGLNATNSLELGAGTGTLVGLGSKYIGFTQITLDAVSSWTLNGNNAVPFGSTITELSGSTLIATGTLSNSGAITLDPSVLVVGDMNGTGSVTIGAGSILISQTAMAPSNTITFDGAGAYLHLETPGSAAAAVTNFDLGETIDLKGISPASVSFNNGTLSFTGGSFPLSLAQAEAVVATASGDGAAVALCFCVNTMILTPSGERAVQELAVGDLVLTQRGMARPIMWIGTGRVLATRGQRSGATPVIVRRHAVADNVPNRDLHLTKGHALHLDDVLMPVECLVNHRSIEWDDHAQEVDLYHIELESHDVLIANGAPAESYRDDGNRWLFRNANSGWGLPAQEPCAPIMDGGAAVDAVWRRLLERTGARPGFHLTGDPDLHLLVDGQRVEPMHRRGGLHVFRVMQPPRSVRIVSRAAAPQEIGVARDPRLLGVALRSIAVQCGRQYEMLDVSEASLSEGFHAFEPLNGLRWTDGDAPLPGVLFEGLMGVVDIEVHVAETAQYVADEARAAA